VRPFLSRGILVFDNVLAPAVITACPGLHSDSALIQHTVLFKFPSIANEVPEPLAVVVAKFNSLPGIVAHFAPHGVGIGGSADKAGFLELVAWPDKSDGFTHCLLVAASDPPSLKAYLHSDEHLQEWMAAVKPFFQGIVVFGNALPPAVLTAIGALAPGVINSPAAPLAHGSGAMDPAKRKAHVKYFARCLDGLTHHYTALDQSRMSMLYFCVVALDILGALEEVVDKDHADGRLRGHIIEWVYNCQVPPSEAFDWRHCGFKGGTYMGQKFRASSDGSASGGAASDGAASDRAASAGGYKAHAFDCAHVAMTYTALAVLVTLGDDLSRVHRAETLRAVAALQRPDGSFTATPDGSECDMRFLYCAAAVGSMLGDDLTDGADAAVDKGRAVTYVRSCIGVDGGISLVPDQESHGGSTFTGVAALTLLGCLGDCFAPWERSDLEAWCLRRQASPQASPQAAPDGFVGGMTGRPNKDPDTCYSFWIGGALTLVGSFGLVHRQSVGAFVATCEVPFIGGFSKNPGENPDILHSFYSLCWKSLCGDYGMEPLDGALVVRRSRLIQQRQRQAALSKDRK
jgi:geranylgeranyl transferase type-1 subunit beta